MAVSPITFVASIEHQKKSHWDFFFLNDINMKYKIKSISLPLPKFEIETRDTWENFYKTLSLNTSFSLEIYEDIGFSTYQYFKNWRDSIYNINTRTFISYAPEGPNPITRTAIFNYYTGQINQSEGNFQGVPNFNFTLQNIKLLGLGELTNDYEDGGALFYTIELTYEGFFEFFKFPIPLTPSF